MAPNTKICPFCAEKIDICAEKCAFCDETLSTGQNIGEVVVSDKETVSEISEFVYEKFSICGKLLFVAFYITAILFVAGCYKTMQVVLLTAITPAVYFFFLHKNNIVIDRKNNRFSCPGTMYYARDIFECLSIFYWFSDFKRIEFDLSTLTGINTYKLGNKFFAELSDGVKHCTLKVENEAVLRDLTRKLQEASPGIKTETHIPCGAFSIYCSAKIFYFVWFFAWCSLVYNSFVPTSWYRPEWLKNYNERIALQVDCANEIKAEFAKDEKLRGWKISNLVLVQDKELDNMYHGKLYLEYKGYAPVLSVLVIVTENGSKFVWTLQAQELQQLKERYIY